MSLFLEHGDKKIRLNLKCSIKKQDRVRLPVAVGDFKVAKLSDDDKDLPKAERIMNLFKATDGELTSVSLFLVKYRKREREGERERWREGERERGREGERERGREGEGRGGEREREREAELMDAGEEREEGEIGRERRDGVFV